MDTSISRRCTQAAVACLLAAALAAPSHAFWGRKKGPEPVGAVLSAVVGDVQLQEKGAGAWKTAGSQRVLRSGDNIMTKRSGRAVVVFVDGTKLKLSGNAAFRLESHSRRKVNVKIALGRLEAWVRKIKGRRFQIRTPSSVAAVRGTTFITDCRMADPKPMTPALFAQAMADRLDVSSTFDLFSGGLDVADNFGNSMQLDAGHRLSVDPAKGLAETRPEPIPPNVQMSPEPQGDDKPITDEPVTDEPDTDEPVTEESDMTEPPPPNPQQDSGATCEDVSPSDPACQ